VSVRSDAHQHWLAPGHELAQLAFESGGRAVTVEAAGLESMYRELGADLRSLYQIGFVPTDAARDGQWHPISIRVPARDDVHVWARSGYYAPRSDPQ
jgi:VWFA-related protein